MGSRGVRTDVPAAVHVRSFRPGDETAFRLLNEAWISRYFGLEEKDRETIGDPVGRILRPGGHVFMAVAGEPIGCCALLFLEPGVFEVAKMTVAESHQGRGIGRQLLLHVIAEARRRGAVHLYLETNHTLANAIHLYESVGFQHVAPERTMTSRYARATVFMEMSL